MISHDLFVNNKRKSYNYFPETSGHFVFKLYCLRLIVNPLHPKIILLLLHSVLYKLPMALEGEFVQQSKGFLSWL